MVTPSASSTPSTSASSTSTGGVTIEAVIEQLQRMDACFDTLTTELYQLNTCVSHIARQHARLGGFIESPSPSPKASEDGTKMVTPMVVILIRMRMLALLVTMR